MNLTATNGRGGISATATLTATGLVPRKRTAKSSEASVKADVLSSGPVTGGHSTPGPFGTQPSGGSTVTEATGCTSPPAGLPEIRFHDLRHACATLLLSEGVPVKVVQEVLGYSCVSVTMGKLVREKGRLLAQQIGLAEPNMLCGKELTLYVRL